MRYHYEYDSTFLKCWIVTVALFRACFKSRRNIFVPSWSVCMCMYTLTVFCFYTLLFHCYVTRLDLHSIYAPFVFVVMASLLVSFPTQLQSYSWHCRVAKVECITLAYVWHLNEFMNSVFFPNCLVHNYQITICSFNTLLLSSLIDLIFAFVWINCITNETYVLLSC